ncbi:MAG: methyltransferase domain-containing protein [Bacteroidetes bacterium]|nr:MAG: methyltransferase domain-containing protein [Bacteroidota bacterium]
MTATATTVVFTFDPGLEAVVEQEWQEHLLAAGWPMAEVRGTSHYGNGLLFLHQLVPGPALQKLVLNMRSIHYAYQLMGQFELDKAASWDRFEAALREIPIPALEAATSFRVSPERHGNHAFSSYDMAKAAGDYLRDRYQLPVDLENYSHNVRVDLRDRWGWVGVQLHPDRLSRRHRRRYQHRAALQPTVAYGLLRLTGLPEGMRGALLDPFCGSGTILIEAAALWPEMELYGTDLVPEVLDGAQRNLEAAGLETRVRLHDMDARQLPERFPSGRFRAIVTNPPYGLRLGRQLNLYWFYRDFLAAARQVLAIDGRLVLLVLKAELFRDVLRESGAWKVRHEQRLDAGGKHLRAFVLQPRDK